jgi:hypothetical protein
MEWIQIQQKGHSLSTAENKEHVHANFLRIIPPCTIYGCLVSAGSPWSDAQRLLTISLPRNTQIKNKTELLQTSKCRGETRLHCERHGFHGQAICFLWLFVCLLGHLLNRRISHLPKKSAPFFELKNIWTRSKNNFALNRGKLLPD